jgi:hypothetical protein
MHMDNKSQDPILGAKKKTHFQNNVIVFIVKMIAIY